jgi:hypothetical protein
MSIEKLPGKLPGDDTSHIQKTPARAFETREEKAKAKNAVEALVNELRRHIKREDLSESKETKTSESKGLLHTFISIPHKLIKSPRSSLQEAQDVLTKQISSLVSKVKKTAQGLKARNKQEIPKEVKEVTSSARIAATPQDKLEMIGSLRLNEQISVVGQDHDQLKVEDWKKLILPDIQKKNAERLVTVLEGLQNEPGFGAALGKFLSKQGGPGQHSFGQHLMAMEEPRNPRLRKLWEQASRTADLNTKQTVETWLKSDDFKEVKTEEVNVTVTNLERHISTIAKDKKMKLVFNEGRFEAAKRELLHLPIGPERTGTSDEAKETAGELSKLIEYAIETKNPDIQLKLAQQMTALENSSWGVEFLRNNPSLTKLIKDFRETLEPILEKEAEDLGNLVKSKQPDEIDDALLESTNQRLSEWQRALPDTKSTNLKAFEGEVANLSTRRFRILKEEVPRLFTGKIQRLNLLNERLRKYTPFLFNEKILLDNEYLLKAFEAVKAENNPELCKEMMNNLLDLAIGISENYRERKQEKDGKWKSVLSDPMKSHLEKLVAEMKSWKDSAQYEKIEQLEGSLSPQGASPYSPPVISHEAKKEADNRLSEIRKGTIEKEALEAFQKGVVDELRTVTSAYMSRLQPTEFFNQAWQTGDKRNAPNLDAYSKLFNSISFQAAVHILEGSNLKEVAHMIRFYASLCDQCIRDGNYQVAAAIDSGLEREPIKRIIRQLSQDSDFKKTNKLLIANHHILSFSDSKNRKEHMQKAHQNGIAVLPFIAPDLGNLTISAENKVMEENAYNGNRLQVFGRILDGLFDLIKNVKNAPSADSLPTGAFLYDYDLLDTKNDDSLYKKSFELIPKKQAVQSEE